MLTDAQLRCATPKSTLLQSICENARPSSARQSLYFAKHPNGVQHQAKQKAHLCQCRQGLPSAEGGARKPSDHTAREW